MDGLCDVKGCRGLPLLGWRPSHRTCGCLNQCHEQIRDGDTDAAQEPGAIDEPLIRLGLQPRQFSEAIGVAQAGEEMVAQNAP